MHRSYIIVALALTALIALTTLAWPDVLLKAGYMSLQHPQQIAYLTENITAERTERRFDDSVSVLTFADNTRWFAHNGYVSLAFGPGGLAELQETITAAAPYLFGRSHDRALVIGLASGVTAGVAGTLYTNTTAVEINPAVFDVLGEFSDINLDVANDSSISIRLEDGVTTLATAETKYDLIVNSVPSPTYYAASKLWTHELFALVNTRLTDGGIYSGWFDARIEKEGLQTMLKTLDSVFADCTLIMMSASYFNTICSNEPLTITDRPQHTWPAPLQEKFARYGITDIPAFLTDLVTTPDPALYNHPDVPLNTLNRPVLEFTSLRPFSNRETGDFLATLARGIFTGDDTERNQNKCESVRVLVPNTAMFGELFGGVCG